MHVFEEKWRFFLKSCKSIWWNREIILPLHSQLSNAEIAQLVEHNLAKVGVAGPSPVFRSIIFVLNQDRFKFRAQVAELVDAHVSGACVSQRAGSSPVLGTYV